MSVALPRVLIVHNTYQHRGGEDAVVEDEVKLLIAHGHAVKTYFRHNDEIAGRGRIGLAQETLWSRRTMADIVALVNEFKPDVIHAHNTFPLISPSLYWAADRAGVPVVQTLHNFRLLCPQAMFLREGKVCEDCIGRLPWRGVVRSCYRDSMAQSGVLTGMLALHRGLGTYVNKITRFIALSEFSRNKFIEGGLPADKISVKPNFVELAVRVDSGDREGLLFVGRLSPEKGISVLAEAMRCLPNARLTVVGEGPEANRFNELNNTALLGLQSSQFVLSAMSKAETLILPSICYENFPKTVVEAFASGLPVIASRLGAMAELVDDGRTGLLFDPGNSHDLKNKIEWALAHRAEIRKMGEQARQEYEQKYTSSRNYEQLLPIYLRAISDA